MRHLKKGRKFGRTRNQRRSLLRSLAYQLVTHERIQTSEAKAKELAPVVEKLITKAKRDTLATRRLLASRLPSAAAKKLVTVLGPRFRARTGGYTRIIKLPVRKSDASQRAIIELVH